MTTIFRHVTGGLAPLATRAFSAVQEEGEHAATFLGIAIWIWQLANLTLFLGLLVYFLARPLAAAFRQRQIEVERRRREAEERRAEAARLEREIDERMRRLDHELSEIRARGAADGEAERKALMERADLEAERVRREAEQEIARRLESAKAELRRAAAELTTTAARELVEREITEEDRRRLLAESVKRIESAR